MRAADGIVVVIGAPPGSGRDPGDWAAAVPATMIQITVKLGRVTAQRHMELPDRRGALPRIAPCRIFAARGVRVSGPGRARISQFGGSPFGMDCSAASHGDSLGRMPADRKHSGCSAV